MDGSAKYYVTNIVKNGRLSTFKFEIRFQVSDTIGRLAIGIGRVLLQSIDIVMI